MSDPVVPLLTRATRSWFLKSPLESHADGYVRHLRDLGYAPRSIQMYLVSVAHFAHWLSAKCVGLVDIDEINVFRFSDRHLPVCQCATRVPRLRNNVRPALLHLLNVLRFSGLIVPKMSADPQERVRDLQKFERYLADVRGLTPVTCDTRVNRVRSFLLDRFGSGGIRLNILRRNDVIGFMGRYTANWKPSSKQGMASALRSYFRFKANLRRADHPVGGSDS